MSLNVQHFLKEEIYRANKKNKLKWWLGLGGGIEQVFDCYSMFGFNLENSEVKFKIEQICDKGFWRKFLDLFKRVDPYYEITCEYVLPKQSEGVKNERTNRR